MASLLDIAPVTEKVQGVTVYGVSARGVAQLLYRFPVLRAAFAGRDVSAEDLSALGPDVIAAIIAAGTGSPGDEAAEAAADRLGIETQLDFLEAVLRVTLPNGARPLMQKVERLSGLLGGDPSTTAPAPKSRRRSKPSSPEATGEPGTTLPANSLAS